MRGRRGRSAAVLGGYARPKAEEVAMATQGEERNKAVVREVNQRMIRKDMSVYEEHPGLIETREFFPRLLRAFPDLEVRIESIIGEGDHVAMHAWYEGTHKGELMGYAPTGRRLKFQVVAMDRLVDGRIVQHNAEAGFARAIFQARPH
jgi:predicted ester cyclase